MERFEVLESMESILPALEELEAELRLAASNGLATATLVFLLLCASREGMAQTGSGATGGVLHGGTQTAMLVSTSAIDAAVVPVSIDPTLLRRARELDLLLAVRGGHGPITAKQTDAAITAAVLQGTNPELKKRNPFEKRSNDLFRAQRQVHVGRQAMEVRLRVKPKKREAMAVEFRF